MHRRATNVRIASADPAVRRITYGCINVPPAFYDQVVHPQFKRKGGIVHVLPEATPVRAVFKAHGDDRRAQPVQAQIAREAVRAGAGRY